MPPHWKIVWKIPRTEKPGRLQSMGSQRVNMTEQLSTLAAVLSLRSGLGMPPGSLLHSSSSLPSLQRLRFSPPHASCLRKSPLTQPFKNKDLKNSKKTILKGHCKAIQLPIQRQKIFQESDKRKMQLEGKKTDNYFIKLLCYIFSKESLLFQVLYGKLPNRPLPILWFLNYQNIPYFICQDTSEQLSFLWLEGTLR